jgi:hypothetical protein
MTRRFYQRGSLVSGGENQLATYDEIRAWLKERYGYTAQNCWIADVKARHGLTGRMAHNRSGSKRVKPCPADRVPHIEEALRHLGAL